MPLNKQKSGLSYMKISEKNYMILQEGRSADGDYKEVSMWAVDFLRDYSEYLVPPILEIGCGNGAVLEHLKKQGKFAMGLDISRPSVGKCIEHGFPAVWQNAEDDFPFPDKSFKTVITFHTLEHCRDIRKVIRNISRVLDGNLCAVAPEGHGPEKIFDKYTGHFTAMGDLDKYKTFFKDYNILVAEACPDQISLLVIGNNETN